MSAIGKSCLFCNETIIMEPEASSCLRCEGVFHRQCAETAEQQCPTCKDRIDDAERAYRFSLCCSECLRPNNPPEARCKTCGNWTRWANEAEYQKFLTEHRARCRKTVTNASLQLALVVIAAMIFGFFILGTTLIGIGVLAIATLKAASLIGTIVTATRRLAFR